MELQGKCISFLGEKSGVSRAGNPWKKKEWVIETYGQFPKKIKVQCFGDRSDSMNIEPGKDYTLSVDIESREVNGNWFTDVSVFRVVESQAPTFGGAAGEPQPQYGNMQAPLDGPGSNPPFVDNSFNAGQPFMPQEGGEEDLPF